MRALRENRGQCAVALLLRPFDSRCLDRGREGFEILFENRFGLLLAEAARHDTKLTQSLGDFGRLRQCRDLIANRRNDRLGRSSWRKETVPGRELKARQYLRNRRNIRRRSDSLCGSDRNQPYLVVVDVGQEGGRVAEIKIDLS